RPGAAPSPGWARCGRIRGSSDGAARCRRRRRSRAATGHGAVATIASARRRSWVGSESACRTGVSAPEERRFILARALVLQYGPSRLRELLAIALARGEEARFDGSPRSDGGRMPVSGHQWAVAMSRCVLVLKWPEAMGKELRRMITAIVQY